jgi:IclR family pca regulon transcriptional regulator
MVREVPEPKYSRSLEYGAAILLCFTSERPVLGISQLADLVGISRSTTHRYALTLMELGYLEQDDKRRYRLSLRAADPGMRIVETIRRETVAAARILEDLRDETLNTVSMAVLDGLSATYTHRIPAHGKGQYEADLGLGAGAHIPAYCTAIGKALLASLSAPDQRDVLARLTLKRHGPNTITSKRALVQELLDIQVNGLALSDEEQARHVSSIAVAVTRPGRSRPMAISVTVPSNRYTLQEMTVKLGPHIRAAAERI